MSNQTNSSGPEPEKPKDEPKKAKDEQPKPADDRIKRAWSKFVKSLRSLMVPQREDRPLDQFLPFRDAVLDQVEAEDFQNHLYDAFASSNILAPAKDIFLMELEVFPLAAEVAQHTAKPEESKGWWKNMLGRAKTVTESTKDLFGNAPYVKEVLTLLSELISVFKGSD